MRDYVALATFGPRRSAAGYPTQTSLIASGLTGEAHRRASSKTLRERKISASDGGSSLQVMSDYPPLRLASKTLDYDPTVRTMVS